MFCCRVHITDEKTYSVLVMLVSGSCLLCRGLYTSFYRKFLGNRLLCTTYLAFYKAIENIADFGNDVTPLLISVVYD